MNKNPLSELSNEKLLKRRDSLKGLLIAFGVILVFLIGLAIYFYFTKSNAKLFVPLMAIPFTLMPVYIQLRALNAELKLRSQK